MNRFVRKNQIEIRFEREKEKPTREEAKKWLKNELLLGTYKLEGVQFDRLGLKIYIEFTDEQEVKKFLDTNGYDKHMTTEKHEQIQVTFHKCDEEIKLIRIYSLPMGMNNQSIEKSLMSYGKIKSIQDERYAAHDDCFAGLKTGVKIVYMILQHDIPSYIEIEGHRVIIVYNGQPKTCSLCNSVEHLRHDCPKGQMADERLRNMQTEFQRETTRIPISFAEMISLNNKNPSSTSSRLINPDKPHDTPGRAHNIDVQTSPVIQEKQTNLENQNTSGLETNTGTQKPKTGADEKQNQKKSPVKSPVFSTKNKKSAAKSSNEVIQENLNVKEIPNQVIQEKQNSQDVHKAPTTPILQEKQTNPEVQSTVTVHPLVLSPILAKRQKKLKEIKQKQPEKTAETETHCPMEEDFDDETMDYEQDMTRLNSENQDPNDENPPPPVKVKKT